MPGDFPVFPKAPTPVPRFGLLESPLCFHNKLFSLTLSWVSFSFPQTPNDPQIIQSSACSPEPAPPGQIVISSMLKDFQGWGFQLS